MALVVTVGGTTTNSYITVAEYTAYWASRNATLTGSTAETEGRLIEAADYINRTYDFVGERQYQY